MSDYINIRHDYGIFYVKAFKWCTNMFNIGFGILECSHSNVLDVAEREIRNYKTISNKKYYIAIYKIKNVDLLISRVHENPFDNGGIAGAIVFNTENKLLSLLPKLEVEYNINSISVWSTISQDYLNILNYPSFTITYENYVREFGELFA